MTTFDGDGGIGADVTKGEGRRANASIDSHAAADSSLGASSRDGFPVCRNGTHTFVDGLVPLLAVLSATLALQFDVRDRYEGDNDEEGHEDGSGEFASGEVLVGRGSILHDSNGTVGRRSVSNGRRAGGRRVICDSEDGTSGIRGEKRRGARGNDRELKVGGSSRVPPLGFEGSLVRTGRKVDTLPGMDAGGASTGGVEKYVDVGGS